MHVQCRCDLLTVHEAKAQVMIDEEHGRRVDGLTESADSLFVELSVVLGFFEDL